MEKNCLKIFVVVLLGVLLLCLSFSSAVAANGKFYSRDGKFRVSFEGEPRELRQDQDSENGKMTWIAYAYKAVNYLGIVMYCDLPKSITVGIDSQVMIKQVGESMVDSADTIISETPMTISGFNGIEVISDKENTYTRRILLMVGQRMYIYGIETTKDWLDLPKIEDFLNSFELVVDAG